MEKLKLLPCPWCGETPIVNCYYNNYWIDCTCGVIKHVKCANTADAVKDWNRLNTTGKEREKIMKLFQTREVVDGMINCRKKPIIIQAKVIDEPFQVETLEGNYKTGKPGDMLMKGIDNELYICDRDIFDRTYDWIV